MALLLKIKWTLICSNGDIREMQRVKFFKVENVKIEGREKEKVESELVERSKSFRKRDRNMMFKSLIVEKMKRMKKKIMNQALSSQRMKKMSTLMKRNLRGSNNLYSGLKTAV